MIGQSCFGFDCRTIFSYPSPPKKTKNVFKQEQNLKKWEKQSRCGERVLAQGRLVERSSETGQWQRQQLVPLCMNQAFSGWFEFPEAWLAFTKVTNVTNRFAYHASSPWCISFLSVTWTRRMTGRAHKRTIVLASILKMWRFQNNIDKTDTKLSQIGKCKWCLFAFSWTLASQLCTLSSVRLSIISLQLVKRQTKYTIICLCQ